MKNEEKLICKYCGREKVFFDCNKLAKQLNKFLIFLFVANLIALVILKTFSLFAFLIFVFSYYLINKRKVVTCQNVDCIGFQDECKKLK